MTTFWDFRRFNRCEALSEGRCSVDDDKGGKVSLGVPFMPIEIIVGLH